MRESGGASRCLTDFKFSSPIPFTSMKTVLRLSLCALLASCATQNPQLKKPSAETLRKEGVPEAQLAQSLDWSIQSWARQVLLPGSGAGPKQIQEAREILKDRKVTMMVLPVHDLDSMEQPQDPMTEMYGSNRITFKCDLLSLKQDRSGKYTAALQFINKEDETGEGFSGLVDVTPSIDTIQVSSSRLGQFPLPKGEYSVTLSPEGRVVMLNYGSSSYDEVKRIEKLRDGRYQLLLSDPDTHAVQKTIVDHLDDYRPGNHPDEFQGAIDYFSLSSTGWTIWNYEKGAGGSDLSWVKSLPKRGSFD